MPSAVWRGDFLDGAALAAQVLERRDATEKLGVAWMRAPSLLRLLRWLLAGKSTAAMLRKRARTALEASPTKSPRLLGLLHVVLGDVPVAAALLQKAPGLGWSSGDHPGHLLFPAFAWMLGGAPAGSAHERVAQVLRSTAREFGDFDDAGAEDPGSAKAATPRLSRPSVMDALERAEVTKKLTAADRASALAAMKAAATKRTDGVLENKRRRHYAHAALLVACCVELEGGTKSAGGSAWAASIRTGTQRFPAFQHELRSALEQVRR